MKRSAVINIKNLDRAVAYLKENRLLILILVFFFVGLFIGVFSYDKDKEVCISISESLIKDFSEIPQKGFFLTLLDSFFNSLLFSAICFICGCSMLGVVLSPLCILINGLLYGFLSAALYSEFALKGIAFYAVMVLPSAVILTIALIMAVMESVNFSAVLTKLTFPTTPPQNLCVFFRSFCIRYLIILLFVLLSSVIDALISCKLAGNFVLY